LLLLLKHPPRLVSLRLVSLRLGYVHLFFVAATVLAALARLPYLLVVFRAICSPAHADSATIKSRQSETDFLT
jgi:hypothetical protein